MLPIFILRVNTTLNCTVTFYFENLLAIGNSSFLTVYLEKSTIFATIKWQVLLLGEYRMDKKLIFSEGYNKYYRVSLPDETSNSGNTNLTNCSFYWGT